MLRTRLSMAGSEPIALVTCGQSCRCPAAGAACAWAANAVKTQAVRRVFRALLTCIYLQENVRVMDRARADSTPPVTALSYKPGGALSTVRQTACPGLPVVVGLARPER